MRLTRRSHESGLTVLRVSPPIRTADLSRLRKGLLRLLDESAETLIDLRGVDRPDLALVQTIIATRKSAARRGVTLEIVCDESFVQAVHAAGLASMTGV